MLTFWCSEHPQWPTLHAVSYTHLDVYKRQALPFNFSEASDSNNVHGISKKLPQFDAKIFDKKQRNITEIRIFFDDQTWETFLPKK